MDEVGGWSGSWAVGPEVGKARSGTLQGGVVRTDVSQVGTAPPPAQQLDSGGGEAGVGCRGGCPDPEAVRVERLCWIVRLP